MDEVVRFGKDMPVTNSACCSNGKVMCQKCAAAAIAAAGGQPTPPGATNNDLPFEDDGLPLPSINWQQEVADRKKGQRQQAVLNATDDVYGGQSTQDCLPPPVQRW